MALNSLRSAFEDGSAASKIELPKPELELDFRICVQLNPLIPVGKGPWGQRNWISFKSGQWKATWGQGTVEVNYLSAMVLCSSSRPSQPGGQDSQVVLPDSLYTYVSTN